MAEETALLEVKHLSVDYISEGKQPAHALEDVSFQLRRGEMLGVVGESGCGKTTLMLALLRLLPAAGRIVAGQIKLQGRDLLDLSETQMADDPMRTACFYNSLNVPGPNDKRLRGRSHQPSQATQPCEFTLSRVT